MSHSCESTECSDSLRNADCEDMSCEATGEAST